MAPQTGFSFDAPWELIPGAVLIFLALGFTVWQLLSRDLTKGQVAILVGLRGAALVMILLLAAKPVLVQKMPHNRAPYVAVLLDRSASMSLQDADEIRFSQATHLLKNKLAPALQNQNWKVHPWLFAENAKLSTAEDISVAEPTGTRTSMANAILQASQEEGDAPLAIIALTDGISNDQPENAKALSSLIDRHIPFFAIGFGSDEGPSTLQLQRVTGPNTSATKQQFRVVAQLCLSGSGTVPNFDMTLSRDGKVVQTKTVQGFSGSRSWTESFAVSEDLEGRHDYTVEMAPPESPRLVIGQRKSSVQVNISDDKEMRILYVQGTLTWDYKFINLALKNDRSLRITGLSQTSDHSVYRQNVENAGELLDGFPTTVEQIRPLPGGGDLQHEARQSQRYPAGRPHPLCGRTGRRHPHDRRTGHLR